MVTLEMATAAGSGLQAEAWRGLHHAKEPF
jgi:hypothetical protein